MYCTNNEVSNNSWNEETRQIATFVGIGNRAVKAAARYDHRKRTRPT